MATARSHATPAGDATAAGTVTLTLDEDDGEIIETYEGPEPTDARADDHAKVTLADVPHDVTVSLEEVTPDDAKQLILGNQARQRGISEVRIEQYAKDMKAGRWTMSDSLICIDPEGNLLNGQHRMAAVIKANTTVRMLLARNFPPEAMPNLDAGRTRSMGDALRIMHDEKHASMLATVSRQLIAIETGEIERSRTRMTATTGEVMSFIARKPSVRDSVKIAYRYSGKILAPVSNIGTTHFLIAQVNGPEMATGFFNTIADPDHEPDDSVIHALNRRLSQLRERQIKVAARTYIYMMVKSWNCWAEDAPALRIAWEPRNEWLLPEVAPWGREDFIPKG